MEWLLQYILENLGFYLTMGGIVFVCVIWYLLDGK
jgi:hypothetical protein